MYYRIFYGAWNMSALINLIIVIIAFAIASRLAGYVVDSVIRLASLMRVRASVFAFIFVSISTSLPELSVAIFSGLDGKSTLSFGNLMGSNVVNFCLILGILAYSGIKITENVRKEITRSASFVIFVALIILSSKIINPAISLVLFILFVFHVYSLGKVFHLPRIRYFIFTPEFIKDFFVFIFSSVFVVIFSSIGVESALKLAKEIGVLEAVLGGSIIAIETSLPELLVATNALLKKRIEVSIGDITGSNVINSTLLLGIAGIISTITISPMEKLITMFSLFSAGVLILLSSLDKFDKKISFLLFSIFLIYLIFILFPVF